MKRPPFVMRSNPVKPDPILVCVDILRAAQVAGTLDRMRDVCVSIHGWEIVEAAEAQL